MNRPNYNKTLKACYLGFITQAISANFAPLLFLRFHNEYNIPFGQIALLSSAFYITQILVDVFCAKFVDAIGYRKSAVASELFSTAGLLGMAILPNFVKNPFAAILFSVIIYAMGSGLIEVLGSPIVEACPFEHKDSVMSLLHSFYCWGSAAVILISTAFFAVAGIRSWKILACLWAILPLYNAYNFATCPIERLTEEGEALGFGTLIKMPKFWLFILLMIGAGASEAGMAQWASAYVEAALGFPKAVGDIAGPCLFAVAMGLSRAIYGKFGEKIDLKKFMLASGVLCLGCYLAAALCTVPIIGLLGCIVCGFSVGILWPGTISVASRALPQGGTALFALLAMGGDMGASVGPGLVGVVTQAVDNNMKAGMLAGCIFPVIIIVAIGKMFLKSKAHK